MIENPTVLSFMHWLDNGSSCLLVFACWWLAHQYGAMKTRYRRTMSICFSLLGIAVLLSMAFRVAGVDPIAGGIFIKMLVTAILLYIALFIRRNFDIG